MKNKIPRLLYLAGEHHPPLPNRKLLRFLPQSDLIVEVAASGLGGAAAQHGLSESQLRMLYAEGSQGGRGTAAEFQMMVSEIILNELDLRRPDFTLTEYLTRLSELHDYAETSGASLIHHTETNLADAPYDEIFPKWDTGFTPFDEVVGGAYQSLVTLMGRSGDGKTSMMLAMMESMRLTGSADELWFFETEIPQSMMLYRMHQMRQRTRFRQTDLLICGAVTVSDILARVRENPNPRRVIFIDSPDVIAGGIGEGRRFALEAIYRDLVPLKEQCKMVVTASQVRRNNRRMVLEDVAEAWAKTWYTDIVCSFSRLQSDVNGDSLVRLNVLKNRFGIGNRYIKYNFNYADLSWQSVSGPIVDGSDEDFEESQDGDF